MDTNKYLKKLEISPDEVELSYEFLCRLQFAHVTHIPYENLDILDGIPLKLDAESVFDKVINSRRGGYCFELNGLLSSLLRELGFCVRDFLGRFLKNEPSLPVRRHRVIAVDLGGETYICDVGMGQTAPKHPLRLAAGVEQRQFGESYKFEYDDIHGWTLYEFSHGEWRKFCSFTEEKQFEVDFILPSFYCEKHPDSPFTRGVMVAIKTENGRKAINDRDFKIFADGKLTYIEENMTDERRLEVLSLEFGIDWRK